MTALYFCSVRKTENFIRFDRPVLFSADNMPAGRSAYIYCKVILFHNIFFVAAAKCGGNRCTFLLRLRRRVYYKDYAVLQAVDGEV